MVSVQKMPQFLKHRKVHIKIPRNVIQIPVPMLFPSPFVANLDEAIMNPVITPEEMCVVEALQKRPAINTVHMRFITPPFRCIPKSVGPLTEAFQSYLSRRLRRCSSMLKDKAFNFENRCNSDPSLAVGPAPIMPWPRRLILAKHRKSS